MHGSFFVIFTPKGRFYLSFNDLAPATNTSSEGSSTFDSLINAFVFTVPLPGIWSLKDKSQGLLLLEAALTVMKINP